MVTGIERVEGSGNEDELKARLFRRRLPLGYQEVINQSPFIHWPRPFSHYLVREYTDNDINLIKMDEEGADGIEAQKLFEAVRTPFGERVAAAIEGKVVVDLGCGSYPFVRTIAKASNARIYIGIDDRVTPSFTHETGFRSLIVQMDMLAALAQMSQLPGIVFHLSGIDPSEYADLTIMQYEQDSILERRLYPTSRAYIHACLEEMKRLAKPGDAILTGQQARGFHPERYQFEPTIKGNYEYVLYVKV